MRISVGQKIHHKLSLFFFFFPSRAKVSETMNHPSEKGGVPYFSNVGFFFVLCGSMSGLDLESLINIVYKHFKILYNCQIVKLL